MFIVKDKKITNSKVLDIGKRRSVDLAFAFDVSFADADKFQLSIADNKNTLYGFTNSGKLSFAKVDLVFIGKEETEVAVSIKHNGIEILADSINVLAVIQGGGQIILPEVTVTADKMLKDITAINTDGDVVTGNIENAVITTDEVDGLTVSVSKGYVSADVAESFASATVTETDTEVTVSRGWLKADQTFSVGGSSDVQGIIYNDFPLKASTQVKIIPPELTKDATSFSSMFSGYSALTTIPALDTSNGTSFSNMFNGCSALTSVPALDTSNGTSFSNMFNGCSALTSVPALDTSKGTNFSVMFQACNALTSVPALDTSKGTNFGSMFGGCWALTTIPALDTSNGTNFSNMFSYCNALTTIPALDTSNGTNFINMFQGCDALTTIQGINFSSVTSAISSNIFYNCSALKNVTFNGTLSQSIDISNAPNLTQQSLQSLVDACVAVSMPKYITATGNALTILNSWFKTQLTNKNWGIKEG